MGKASRKKVAKYPLPSLPAGYVLRALDRTSSREVAAANALVVAVGLAESADPIGPGEFPQVMDALVAQIRHPKPGRRHTIDLVIIEESTGDVVGVSHSRIQPELLGPLLAQGAPTGTLIDALTVIKLAVSPQHRHQRLGSALLQETLRLAAREGYATVAGYADGDADKLRALYEREGFTCGPLNGPNPAAVYGPAAPFLLNIRSGGFFFWKHVASQ